MDDNRYPPRQPANPASIHHAADRSAHVNVFRSSVGPSSKKHWPTTLLIPVVVAVILIVIGLGAYWLFSGNHKAAPTAYKAPSPTVANKATATPGSSNSASSGLQSYSATDFNLTFNYPVGWTVVNSGSGPLTVTSPSRQITAATGQKVTGLIAMMIQQQGKLPTAFSAGTALAVLNSQLISYSHPATTQASQTYLSFVQYSSTNTKGGLDGIYLSGNYGYQKDGVIPPSNIASVNPLITVTFTKCGDSQCKTSLTPLTIASTDWSNNAFAAPIKSMLASLDFQSP